MSSEAAAVNTVASAEYDIARVRADFPILHQMMRGKPLSYLDNAATTQKPQSVIDSLVRYYTEDNANIHRAVHLLSERATLKYENARVRIQKFLNARDSREIIYVRGTTEGINLVAQTYGKANIGEGDEILITGMEHHSNIVPWQMLCEQTGAVLRVVPITDSGEVMLDEFERMLSPRTKLLAVVHVSNALGTINPIKWMTKQAHAVGAKVLIDGAQSVAHTRVDVQELDCDFFVFSGHKIYGPTGIGVLYGKAALLEQMPPWQGGGDMISSVTFEKTTYNTLPYKFEAGTPNIAGAIGLGAALDYVSELGLDVIAAYEHELVDYATDALSTVSGLRIVGTADEKASVVSFVMDHIHPHDIGTMLDQEGVAIRTGHHCAQPVMIRYNIPATARASVACYNTREEIDALVRGLRTVQEMFG